MSMRIPRILVVDDSDTDLTLMSAPLRASGYHVITARDGEEALTKVASEQPQCIVLDVVLPKQNGFQICRQLKQSEQTQHIPIIMVSIKNTPVDKRWGLQQGADIYLAKPFQPNELLDSVRRVL
jgi:DNA-binding response OmpR family regulator